MSGRPFALPIRILSKPQISSQAERWTCKRCLATQTTAVAPDTEATPPLDPATSSTASSSAPAQPYDPTLPFSQRGYALSNTDRLVKRPLPHFVSPQYLQHVQPDMLHGEERKRLAGLQKHKDLVGVVVRTGRMDKTVTVRIPGRRWEARVKKYFADHTNHLVHDPNSSLIQGDVVSLHRLRVSTAVKHVVANIITPFGKPISERPNIPTPEERLATYKTVRLAKLHRRHLRREAAKGDAESIVELRRMGLDPGHGVAAGKGETKGTEKGAGKSRTPSEGGIVGKKGQKMPKGVLPGGKHEVGKIGERAKHNKESAMKMEGKARENQAEAQEKEVQLEREGLRGGSAAMPGSRE